MNFAGKRVVVMGLGRFGGGAGVTRFLASRGATILLTDQDPPDKLTAGLSLIADLTSTSGQVTLRLGQHLEEDFRQCDLVVVNPAVKPDNPFVQAARDAGVPITSEIRLLVAHLPNRAKTIALTGSAGKSTTTAMVGHALAKALGPSHVHVGGNLGGSLLGQLEHIHPDHWVILELSSFMLQGLREDQWSPHIALLTNFSSNHLDWHGHIDHYRHAKQAIFDFQKDETHDIAILAPGDEERFVPRVKDVRLIDVWPNGLCPVDLLVPGQHNRLNARMAAMIVEAAINQPLPKTFEALVDFPGLPHRLQFICEHSAVRFYNDSKATTPEAAILAMDSFGPGKMHIILGGYDKKSDLAAMAQYAAGRCKAIYTIGATGHAIAAAATATVNRVASVHACDDLPAAMELIVKNVRREDVVVLSPGCASWDQYENYEARGKHFAQLALQFTGEGSPNPLV